MGEQAALTGPDFGLGVALDTLAEGQPTLGQAQGEAVVLVRRGTEVLGISATCSHYGGPLAEGLVVGDTVRCPWHHACFSLRTGEALHAPALLPLASWEVEVRDGQVRVVGKREVPPKPKPAKAPGSVVIVGGGAAGHACAQLLRREGYDGAVTILSEDTSPPCDRPNLSKDYLAGNAPEEWIPLPPADEGSAKKVDLRLNTKVTRLDLAGHQVELADGTKVPYDALVLATGAAPNRLSIEGAQLPHVHLLRSLDDSRAIIAGLAKAKKAVVVGSSFIGLEAAASLRTRGLEVHVVSPDAKPLERVFGGQLGGFIQSLHEEKGVVFHLGRKPARITERAVVLDDGSELPADLVVVGIGVKPNLALAEQAGLAIDRGVSVNAYLETSSPGVYAVGDIARWPDRHSGESIRVEHWVVAQRMGQAAARNILGQKQPFEAVPFFWSAHYDVAVNYLGHAERWDQIEIDGELAKRDFHARFVKDGKTLAHVTVGRDLESLKAEAAWG